MPKRKFGVKEFGDYIDNILDEVNQQNLPENMPLVEKILKKKGGSARLATSVKTPGLPRLPKL